MLINDILDKANQRHFNHDFSEKCENCSYRENCPHNCGTCLCRVHFSNDENREYDCPNMADFYVCKYSYRYTSELIHLLSCLESLKSRNFIKVISLGCGPSTDLMALDYLHENGIYSFERLEYRGVDYSESVWKNIYNDIDSWGKEGFSVKRYFGDVCTLTFNKGAWIPDLIVLQYVLSDMTKHSSKNDIENFIEELARFIDDKLLPNSYILLNDINLSVTYGGGREYYDLLFSKLKTCEMVCGRFHDDNNASGGYRYGQCSWNEMPSNKNFFSWDYNWNVKYSPFNTCASAFMIIKKVRKNDN